MHSLLSCQPYGENSENNPQDDATSTRKNATKKQFRPFLRLPFIKNKKKQENILLNEFQEQEKDAQHTPLLQSNDNISPPSSFIANDPNFVHINSALFRQLQQEHALDKRELGFSVANEKKLFSVEELRRKLFDNMFNPSFCYEAPTSYTNYKEKSRGLKHSLICIGYMISCLLFLMVCIVPFIGSKQERLIRVVLNEAIFLNQLPSGTVINDPAHFFFTTSSGAGKEQNKELSYVSHWSNISQVKDIQALKHWIVHMILYSLVPRLTWRNKLLHTIRITHFENSSSESLLFSTYKTRITKGQGAQQTESRNNKTLESFNKGPQKSEEQEDKKESTAYIDVTSSSKAETTIKAFLDMVHISTKTTAIFLDFFVTNKDLLQTSYISVRFQIRESGYPEHRLQSISVGRKKEFVLPKHHIVIMVAWLVSSLTLLFECHTFSWRLSHLKVCFHPQKNFESLLAWCIFFTTLLFLTYRLIYYLSLRKTLSITSATSLLSQFVDRTVKINDLQLSEEDATIFNTLVQAFQRAYFLQHIETILLIFVVGTLILIAFRQLFYLFSPDIQRLFYVLPKLFRFYGTSCAIIVFLAFNFSFFSCIHSFSIDLPFLTLLCSRVGYWLSDIQWDASVFNTPLLEIFHISCYIVQIVTLAGFLRTLHTLFYEESTYARTYTTTPLTRFTWTRLRIFLGLLYQETNKVSVPFKTQPIECSKDISFINKHSLTASTVHYNPSGKHFEEFSFYSKYQPCNLTVFQKIVRYILTFCAMSLYFLGSRNQAAYVGFSTSVQQGVLSAKWSSTLQIDKSLLVSMPPQHFLSIHSIQDVYSWIQKCLPDILYPVSYETQAPVVFHSLANNAWSHIPLLAPWISGMPLKSMRLSLFQRNLPSKTSSNTDVAQLPTELEQLNFFVDKTTAAFVSYLPCEKKLLLEYLKQLVQTKEMQSEKTQWCLPLVNAEDNFYALLHLSIELPVSGEIHKEISIQQIDPIFLYASYNKLKEFFLVIFIFCLVLLLAGDLHGWYIFHKRELQFRKNLYEHNFIHEDNELPSNLQNYYLKQEVSENLTFMESILLYFFEISLLDLISFMMLLALCILLFSSLFSSIKSLESLLQTSNLQPFYSFLSIAQSSTRQFKIFLSIFSTVTVVRLLTLTKTAKTIRKFCEPKHQKNILQLLFITLLVFVISSVFLLLLLGSTFSQFNNLYNACISCIFLAIGRFQFQMSPSVNSITFVLWTLIFSVIWQKYHKKKQQSLHQMLLQFFMFYVPTSMIMIWLSSENFCEREFNHIKPFPFATKVKTFLNFLSCHRHERRKTSQSQSMTTQQKKKNFEHNSCARPETLMITLHKTPSEQNMVLNIVDGKKNYENSRDSQGSSCSFLDEQMVSHKQLSHNFTFYELSVLPLLIRLLAQNHITHFNDRFRKLLLILDLKKNIFATPKHMLQLVHEWEQHLSDELQELIIKCKQMEHSLKCHLEVFQHTFQEKENQSAALINELETSLEEKEYELRFYRKE